MNTRITFLYCFLFTMLFVRVAAKSNPIDNAPANICFIENKGQVTDQHGLPRADIQYSLSVPGAGVFIGNGEIHYQFLNRQTSDAQALGARLLANGSLPAHGLPDVTSILPCEVASYRMDVALVGANLSAGVIATEQQAYYEIYFLTGGPVSGIKAQSYRKITYKNVYPDIDWVIYIKGNKLEYEFVVGPGGDASQIKLKYSGAENLKINKAGGLTATTPMGTITERAPLCYRSGFPGIPLSGAFDLNGNIVSFRVSSGHGAGPLVIDPAVEWGTYYGPNTSTSPAYGVCVDAQENVYMCGLTYSATQIATTGTFSDTFAGETDAYLVKFDSSGNRLWGTYYGNGTYGSGIWGTAVPGTWGAALACDPAGNVYMAGSTSCTAEISTPGAVQDTFGGGQWSGYLVKFNASGARVWGTYIGGSPGRTFDLEVASVICDTAWHVFVSGSTDDSSNVGTSGAWKPSKPTGPDTTINDFIVLFDTAGAKQWGTYYGADYRNQNYTGAGCSDGTYVYLSGWTTDTASNSIGTAGAYMPNYGGGQNEAFLAKFDLTGNRVWGTYYGDTTRADDTSQETTGGVACDIYGYVYLLGSTSSATGIATTGSQQPAIGGGNDAFLAKFDPETGGRIWATYYGGPGSENTTDSRIAGDHSGNIYITGFTTSTTGIASPGAWQTSYGGGPQDAFLAEYNNAGVLQWSSFYGGNASDWGIACAPSASGNLYFCGQTNSTNNIATVGGFLPTGGDTAAYYYQAFLVKFVNVDLAAPAAQASAGGIFIYPTPNNGSFTLTATLPATTGTAQVVISDVAGKVIFSQHYAVMNNAITQRVDIAGEEPAGVYFLKIIDGEDVRIGQFTKY
jgi:hypothetical protein